jgi:hypothetical protein
MKKSLKITGLVIAVSLLFMLAWTYFGYNFVPFQEPLTSENFDGDSFSTANKTKIDLSEEFGVPEGIGAVKVFVSIRDSGSSADQAFFALSPNDINGSYPDNIKALGVPDDIRIPAGFVVPCDENGDIYYQTHSTGEDTLDVWLEIWGYWK